jgi:hypothetical protein
MLRECQPYKNSEPTIPLLGAWNDLLNQETRIADRDTWFRHYLQGGG